MSQLVVPFCLAAGSVLTAPQLLAHCYCRPFLHKHALCCVQYSVGIITPVLSASMGNRFAYVLCPFAVFHKNGQLATMLLAHFLVGLYQNIYTPYSSLYLTIDLFIYLFVGSLFYIMIRLQGMNRMYKYDNKRNKKNWIVRLGVVKTGKIYLPCEFKKSC